MARYAFRILAFVAPGAVCMPVSGLSPFRPGAHATSPNLSKMRPPGRAVALTDQRLGLKPDVVHVLGTSIGILKNAVQ